MKVFNFSFDRFMMSRPVYKADLAFRVCVPMPEGKTRRAVCYRICDGWGLQAKMEGSNLWFSFSLINCDSLRPKIAHYWIKGGATPPSKDRMVPSLGIILTEYGRLLLKDLMPSIIY